MRTFTVSNAEIIALSPDGLHLAYADGSEVGLQRLDRGQPPIRLAGHDGMVTSLAFSPGGETLASTSYDRTTTLWDVATGREKLTLRGHRGFTNGVAFSPDDVTLATASEDRTVRTWDIRDGRCLATLPGPGTMTTVAFSPDGDRLAAGHSGTPSAILYRVAGRREMRRLIGHHREVHHLAFHPRSDLLFSGGLDGNVIRWEARDGRLERRWAMGGQFVSALAINGDGSLLATSLEIGQEKDSVLIRDTETNAARGELPAEEARIRSLAFDRAGRRIAVGTASGKVILRDVVTGAATRAVQLRPEVRFVAFLDDGRVMAMDGTSGFATFEPEGIESARRVDLPGGVRCLLVDERRRRLVVAGTDGALRSFTFDGREIGRAFMPIRRAGFNAIALSPDGGLLACAEGDRRAVLRDPESFELLATFPAWTTDVQRLAFDRASSRLAVSGSEVDLQVWDLGLIRDGLAARGLAWDRPGPSVAPAGALPTPDVRKAPAIPTVTRYHLDPALVREAANRRQRGIQSYFEGHPAEAIADLTRARDLYRQMHNSTPADQAMAAVLANSWAFLASALRADHRSSEARAALDEARSLLEALTVPTSASDYDLACIYSVLHGLAAASPGGGGDETLARRAVATLRRAFDAGLTISPAEIETDSDFDPIRLRADFLDAIRDRAARIRPPTSPTAIPAAAGLGNETHARIGMMWSPDPDGVRVDALTPGGPAQEDGRLRVGDTILGVEVAPGQEFLFAGQDPMEITRRVRGEAGSVGRFIVRPQGSQRRVIYGITRRIVSPPTAPTEIEAMDRAIARDPDDLVSRIGRAEYHVRADKPALAVADAVRAFELSPRSMVLGRQAVSLLLESGDVGGARFVARRLLDRSDLVTDPDSLTDLLVSLILVPAVVDDWDGVIRDMQKAGRPDQASRWLLHAMAGVHLRAGRYDEALDELEASDRAGWAGVALNVSLKAVVLARAGRFAEARPLLNLVESYARVHAKDGHLGLAEGPWRDWYLIRFYLREAQALILYDPKFPADPFRR